MTRTRRPSARTTPPPRAPRSLRNRGCECICARRVPQSATWEIWGSAEHMLANCLARTKYLFRRRASVGHGRERRARVPHLRFVLFHGRAARSAAILVRRRTASTPLDVRVLVASARVVPADGSTVATIAVSSFRASSRCASGSVRARQTIDLSAVLEAVVHKLRDCPTRTSRGLLLPRDAPPPAPRRTRDRVEAVVVHWVSMISLNGWGDASAWARVMTLPYRGPEVRSCRDGSPPRYAGSPRASS